MELKAALEKYEDSSFEYGTLDCFLFVCNVILDVTGTDYAAPWRGKYKSAFSALRQLSAGGGFNTAFGPLHPIWSVKKGDPVKLLPPLVEVDIVSEAVGIYDGAVIHCLTEKGLVEVPVMAGKGCWHV